MIRVLALPLVVLALHPFHSSIKPLPAPVRAELRDGGFWHKGCPVALSGLRLLTVTYHGTDMRSHTGQLVVNKDAAAPLAKVFRRLYELHFPIRHMRLADAYGPKRSRPADGDISGSFECRQAVPSPCSGGNGTGTWSNHAYGRAVDLNPTENPYVGCGQTRDPASRPYFNRSRHRRGMVTPAVVQAFRSIGWGWGGDWAGSTKDYMHFSANGH
ncbi:MAG: M15 family metallopeptidase [Actinomycetota bacterium]|nr:M15 family metallopeptidase [Actinomycetota bacterium]